jgi:hypothetical protein
MGGGKGDAEKARYSQKTIGAAPRRGVSIREFCRHRRVKEGQFWRLRDADSGITSHGNPAGGVQEKLLGYILASS